MSTRSTRCAQRIYGVLLYAYPRPFRDRFGAELQQVFRQMLEDRAKPVSSVLLTVVVDHTRSALNERCSQVSGALRRPLRSGVGRVSGIVLVALSSGHFTYDYLVPDRMGVLAVAMTSFIGLVGAQVYRAAGQC